MTNDPDAMWRLPSNDPIQFGDRVMVTVNAGVYEYAFSGFGDADERRPPDGPPAECDARHRNAVIARLYDRSRRDSACVGNGELAG